MRRLIALLCSVFALIIVSACSTNAPVPEGKIAFLLPEKANTRYETQDLPHFKNRLASQGFNVEQNLIYANAEQDAALQATQAREALDAGAKILVLDPVDSEASAEIADLAKERNVPVIAYDRMINNSTGVSYYISFDNEKIGEIQGETLLKALSGKTNPTIIMIHGSPSDNNARFYKLGAHKLLEGRTVIVQEHDIVDWNPQTAHQRMTEALIAVGNNIDGVYAANDGTAGGAIAAMKEAGISPLPPVTGQDAELAAIQRILLGEQYMTVYKAMKLQAEAAADLSLLLLRNVPLDSNIVNAKVNNGSGDVPAILLTPVAVTRDNINSTVIKDGFWSVEQICTPELAAACASAGLQ